MKARRRRVVKSVRRPILLCTLVVCALSVAGGLGISALLESNINRSVHDSVRGMATARATREVQTNAEQAAHRVDETLEQATVAAAILAQRATLLARRPARQDDDSPTPGFLPLAKSQVSWTRTADDKAFAVARTRRPNADDAWELGRFMRELEPLADTLVSRIDGLTRLTFYRNGLGMVGFPAPGPETAGDGPAITARFGPEVLTGEAPGSGSWVGPGSRFGGEAVVTYVQVVEDDEGRPVGAVAAEVSLADLRRHLTGSVQKMGAGGVLFNTRGQVLTASPRAAVLLSQLRGKRAPTTGARAPGSPGGGQVIRNTSDRDLRAMTRALRPYIEGDGHLYPPEEGIALSRGSALGIASRVPAAGWTVAWFAGSLSIDLPAQQGMLEIQPVVHAHALSVLGLSVLVAGLIALGGFSLAGHLRRRLAALVECSQSHAGGDLDVQVDVNGDDEIAAIGVSLNQTAIRLRNNMNRIQESERRLHGLIEHMAEGFVITDEEDRIVFVNQTFSNLLKIPQSSLVGKGVEDYLVPASVETYRRQERPRRDGRTTQYEAEWLGQGGTRVRTIVSGMPLYDEAGQFCGSCGVLTNITNRTRKQEQSARAEKLRALGEMAGGVAHDFNNVLTVVLGNAQYVLLDDDVDESVRQTVKVIERAALDGTETVRRIREFTKPRSLDARATLVDPNAIVRDVVEMARSRFDFAAQREGLEYRVEERHNARRGVRANPSELREALLNMVFNALEAMPDGGHLVVAAFDRGEDEVAIRVEDTGCGMDEQTQKNIFDPFFTKKEGDKCSGLGLSIAFGIIRGHGGNIRVRSREGHGTSFTVVLPSWEAPEMSDETVGLSELAPPPVAGVLLVAGTNKRHETLRKGLDDLGVHIVAVRSASTALTALAEPDAFNTVLVDFDLGEGSGTGWTLCRQISAVHKDVRVILLAEPYQEVDETQARNIGIDRVLIGPFDSRDVEGAVLSVLGAGRALHFSPQGIVEAARAEAEAQIDRECPTMEIWSAAGVKPIVSEPDDSATSDALRETVPELAPDDIPEIEPVPDNPCETGQAVDADSRVASPVESDA